MKKAFNYICILFFLLGLFGCSNGQDISTPSDTDTNSVTSEIISDNVSSIISQNEQSNSEQNNITLSNPIKDEFNAVWFSYFELSDMIKGKSEEKFRETIKTAYKNVADLGLDAVIMHVRPSSDAFYESDIFPWSMYCSGTQGVSPGFDPLKIMVEEAHAVSLQIHAWINPLRVGSQKNFNSLSGMNPAKIWLTDSITDNDDWVKLVSGGYYYNPTVPEVRQLIIDGVVEIIEKYDIDGFQFDDYFYPTTNSQFDQAQFNEYLAASGEEKLNRSQWRMHEVNKLVKGVYSAIKQKDQNIIFGISPSSDIDHNTDILYADIHTWVSTPGYIDYICPQIYFGFEHSTVDARYQNRLMQWSSLDICDEVKLLIGLAPYKIGTEDGGSSEWINSGSMLKDQVISGRSNERVDGFLFYSYTYLFGKKPAQQKELQQLQGMF